MNLSILIAAIVFWLAAWAFNEWLVRLNFVNPAADRAARIAVPLIFGATILVLWEGITLRLFRGTGKGSFPRYS